MKRNQSPCIDVCDFSGPKGWCLGCGRTREECHTWKGMKPYDKNTLQKALKKRMVKIKTLHSEKD
ncbi:hypothetical protein GCE9029_02087 [Grimontia celer]|uniref:Fe-S protein n=1 Tax=Grimontia celer TaxID=1796497 RepID=A0A128F2G8_9GAMM|nr:DUF1289 domain-containing protein [Grimontia celer]CZF80604.1 hypothetical protein GCE9029_02087 [Grimontia celer]